MKTRKGLAQAKQFESEAQQRFAEIVATGKTVSFSAMTRYVRAIAAGETARKPVPRKLKSLQNYFDTQAAQDSRMRRPEK